MSVEDKHTKEPWGVGEVRDSYCIADMGSIAIYPLTVKVPLGNEANKEDARRIVACVNACAGIPTRYLELVVSLEKKSERLNELQDVVYMFHQIETESNKC